MEGKAKTLTSIALEVLKAPGQHLASDTYAEIMKRCAEAGITVTLDEVKRECRAAAGFP